MSRAIDKQELALRRARLVPILPTYCHHYFSRRNGDGVYECMRDGEYWCEGCYQPENEDRPLCARHRDCEACGSGKATKKIAYDELVAGSDPEKVVEITAKRCGFSDNEKKGWRRDDRPEAIGLPARTKA